MIKVTLKDGSVKEYKRGTTVEEIVASIGSGLLKAAMAAKIDGKVVDLSTQVNEDCSLEVLTFDDDQYSLGCGGFQDMICFFAADFRVLQPLFHQVIDLFDPRIRAGGLIRE